MGKNASSIKRQNFISMVMLVTVLLIAFFLLFSAFHVAKKKEDIAADKMTRLCQSSESVEAGIATLQSDFSNASSEKERMMAHEKIMQKKMDLILIENRISTHTKRWSMTCDGI